MHPSTANFVNLRAIAADYIRSHPDDFLPFLPSSGGEDTIEAHEAGLVNRAQFESYCKSVRETAAWGGEPEIVALSRAFKVPIHVVQGGKPPIVVHHPTGGETKPGEPAVWISYHRKLYGLGEVSLDSGILGIPLLTIYVTALQFFTTSANSLNLIAYGIE